MLNRADRHAQAAQERKFGAVIRVFGPGRVAEPASSAVEPAPGLVEPREDRRYPAQQTVAIISRPALAARHRHGAGDQRVGAFTARQHAIGIALAQTERGKDEPVGSPGGDQPAQDRRGERDDFETAPAHAGDALQRAPRLRGDKFEKGFRRAPRDLVLMDDVQRVAGLLDMEPRDRAPRPADEIKRPAGAFAQYRRGRERGFDLLDNGLAVIAEFGESERPERQAD